MLLCLQFGFITGVNIMTEKQRLYAQLHRIAIKMKPGHVKLPPHWRLGVRFSVASYNDCSSVYGSMFSQIPIWFGGCSKWAIGSPRVFGSKRSSWQSLWSTPGCSHRNIMGNQIAGAGLWMTQMRHLWAFMPSNVSSSSPQVGLSCKVLFSWAPHNSFIPFLSRTRDHTKVSLT